MVDISFPSTNDPSIIEIQQSSSSDEKEGGDREEEKNEITQTLRNYNKSINLLIDQT
jgi:hypothetical protein